MMGEHQDFMKQKAKLELNIADLTGEVEGESSLKVSHHELYGVYQPLPVICTRETKVIVEAFATKKCLLRSLLLSYTLKSLKVADCKSMVVVMPEEGMAGADHQSLWYDIYRDLKRHVFAVPAWAASDHLYYIENGGWQDSYNFPSIF